MRFRVWLENKEQEKQKMLQGIWADTFKALGVGGLSDEDAAQQSLSKITFNQRSPEEQHNVFKGKQAVSKRLENGQIFSRLKAIQDPDIAKQVEDTRRWLDTKNSESSANASTTISVLLQKLFGQETFEKFIDADFPKVDNVKAQVPTAAPKQDANVAPEAPAPTNPNTPPAPPQPGPPMSGMMGEQPPMQGGENPSPQAPMPVRPAGAQLGMF
jgi:hypothetical protein